MIICGIAFYLLRKGNKNKKKKIPQKDTEEDGEEGEAAEEEICLKCEEEADSLLHGGENGEDVI